MGLPSLAVALSSWPLGIALALLVLGFFVGAWRLGDWVHQKLDHGIQSAAWKQRTALRLGNIQILGTGWLRALLRATNNIGFLVWRVLIAVLSFLLIVLVLPIWQGLPDAVWTFVQTTGGAMWVGFVGYLPNLGRIVLIVVVFRLVLGAMKWVFEEIRMERIKLRHFDRSWARQTYNLIRFAGIVLAAILIFPFLPGSGTTGFQGIAIFIGALVSIGASSAVSNAVAGIVLTYTKAFDRGERVKVHDTTGDIISRSMFVTHVRNLRNEEIAIPNQLVLASPIINYSRDAGGDGVAVEVKLGIGYDVPWTRVHELLKAAADVEGVMADPGPRVYQDQLGDYAVAYVLHAFIEDPKRMVSTRSAILQRVLDHFAEAGIEILSPKHLATRTTGPVVPGRAPTAVDAEPHPDVPSVPDEESVLEASEDAAEGAPSDETPS